MTNTSDRKQRPTSQTFLLEVLEGRRLFSFGITNTGSSMIVDTGANTVFTVATGNGDLTSVKYDGTELTAPYSQTQRYSHYESGLSSGATTVTSTEDDVKGVIEITATDTSLGVTQYYIARKGYDAIYMGSYTAGNTPPTPGEMRFITYLNKSVFTSEPAASNITGDNAIEGSDVFQDPTSGYTASKFYGATPFIDDTYHGVTGPGVGAFMVIGSHESSSGGPFFKDIEFQTTNNAIEMYNYMYSGHLQTENFRSGLQGPYALDFTNGSAPAALDFSFMDSLNLLGQVPGSGRGSLAGTASGVPAGHSATVGLANSTAEYWAKADGTTGQYQIAGIKPGTYTQTLYDGELAVGTQSVTISAGSSTAANIRDTQYAPTALWTIGSWDGTPLGFLNADKITTMHPSDPRMASWNNVVYTVGTTPDSSWPLEQWKDVNNNNQINFNLSAGQASTPLTLRIGISLAQFGARPQITVNNGQTYAWSSKLPSPSSQPDSRGITRGTWRGNNTTFTYNIPTSALRAGNNTINISVNSGTTGTGFLSPGITYDAIDLVPTSSLTNAPVLTRITVTPVNPTMALNSKQAFIATAFDQFNNPMPANVAWSANNGTIDGTGLYTAGGAPGAATITATSGSVSAQANVTVINTRPLISSGALGIGADTISGTTSTLNVGAIDDGGPSNLSYRWIASAIPAGAAAPDFVATAATPVVTFHAAGTYVFGVTVTDSGGLATSGSVAVTVNQTASSIAISPAATTVSANLRTQFAATMRDQFGTPMASAPALTWSATGGTVSSTGLYKAPAKAGSAIVTAAAGPVFGTVAVNVVTLRPHRHPHKAPATGAA